MSSNDTNGSTPQSGGSSVAAMNTLRENKNTYSSATMIGLIRPQQTEDVGQILERITLVVKSNDKGGTIRETKWDSSKKGWPVGIVQIEGSPKTEDLLIELRQEHWYHLGLRHLTIASGGLTIQEVKDGIQKFHKQIEKSIEIRSQNVLKITGKTLILIIEIDTPSLLPVWITSICLAKEDHGLTDKSLASLDLVFRSGQGKLTFRKSPWDSHNKWWIVGLPQLRGTASQRLIVELRRKRRIGILHKKLASVVLDLEELEQARDQNSSEIEKAFVLPRANKLNIEKLALSVKIGTLRMLPPSTRQFGLPSSVGVILDNISVITGVVDYVSQMLQDKQKLDDNFVALIELMSQVYSCATVEDNPLHNHKDFQELFNQMLYQSIECFLFIFNYISDGHSRHIADAPKKVKEFNQTFKNLKDQLQAAQVQMTSVTALETRDIASNANNTVILHRLKTELERVLESRSGFQLSSDAPRCLDGTRQHTMARIFEWTESKAEGSLLWLSGIAGSGKTTVMATLHDSLTEEECRTPLAAYVRFHRNDFPSPSKFIAALVHGLVSFDHLLGLEVSKRLDAQPKIFQKPLKEQFNSLVVVPLGDYHKQVLKGRGRIVVIVDGLDECMEKSGGSDGFFDLLDLLSNPATFASFPFLRLIVASRPEDPIRRVFTGPDRNHVTRFPLDTSSKETTSDIRHYLHVKFKGIFRADPDFEAFCEERDALNFLAEHSSGLFIWVVTVFRFVERFPRKRLEQALQLSIPHDSLDALNKLYSTVLNTIAAEQGDRDIKAHVVPILGLIIAFGKLPQLTIYPPPLDSSTLCGLLKWLGYNVESTRWVLSQLGSVIEGVDSPQSRLVLLHKSFDDYLADKSRAGEWFVDVEGHWSAKLAESCLCVVHSNVFGDQPDYSDLSLFTHYYWITAVPSSLDTSPVSELFSDILHRGFLRWIYVCTDLRLWGKERGSAARVGGIFGLVKIGRMIAGPKIAQELGVVYANLSLVICARFPEDLEILFLSMLRGEMPEFRKCYMSLFSQISVPSSQHKDFHAILAAIREIRHSESTDRMELFKPVPLESVTTNVEPIDGVPDDEVLSSMLQDLKNTIIAEQDARFPRTNEFMLC